MRGALVAAVALLGLSACAGRGGDAPLSCEEVDRLTNVYIDTPGMSEDVFWATLGADSEAEAQEVLEGCPRG